MVEAREVGYRVGRATILDRISIRFEPNRFNVILGPNGAGKSTLLRVMAGLIRPTSGTALVAGRPTTEWTAEGLAKVRAVLAQETDLAFPLPAEEVALMGRYPHFGRMPSRRDREIVDRALALVGMTERRTQAYPTLSGGERQKVQLARVLAQIWPEGGDPPPRCLFLDEPTANLDIHYQLHLLETARAIRDWNCTVIAILHDLNVAFEFGDAFFLLSAGRLAHRAERGADVPAELLEEVFRVRATRGPGGEWRFGLRRAETRES